MAGYSTPAWTNDASPAIDAAALLAMGQGIELAEHPYGVCSTAAATAAKTVTIDYSGTLTLYTGLTVNVKFTNENSAASPTLNVNSTGAVAIKYYGSTAADSYAWDAGAVVTLAYDGTNWVIVSRSDFAPDGYGLGTAAKALLATDNLNTILESGFYTWDSAPQNGPPMAYLNGYRCNMIVIGHNSNLATQILSCWSSYSGTQYQIYNCIFMRNLNINALTASPWERVYPAVLKVQINSITGSGAINQTYTVSGVSDRDVVLESTFSNPSAIAGDISYTTGDNSIVLSGDVTGTTNLTLLLGKIDGKQVVATTS